MKNYSVKTKEENLVKKNQHKVMENELECIDDGRRPHETMRLDIDIPAINAMCTNYLLQEERCHLESIIITFDKAWKELNHGERIVGDYIKFCQTRKEFSPDFFHLSNRLHRYSKICFLHIYYFDL